MSKSEQLAALEEDLRDAQTRLRWLSDTMGQDSSAKHMHYASKLLERVIAEVESLSKAES